MESFLNIKRWLRKHIGVPSPVDLGRANRDALPIRMFSNKGDYCWEDWRAEVKYKYPIRYFLTETVPFWIGVHIIMNIEHFFYWVKSFLIKKDHLIDLRQPKYKTREDYRWGWLESDKQLVYSCFAILKSYVEHANECSFVYGPNDKDIAKLEKELVKEPEDAFFAIKKQIDELKEIKEIWEYWTVHREKELEAIANLSSRHSKNRSRNSLNKIIEAEKEFADKEEEMLIRLIKVRHVMWV